MSSSAELLALLRRLGVYVRVQHLRWAYNIYTSEWTLKPKWQAEFGEFIGPKGGETHVLLTWQGRDYLGTAMCSKGDTFHRKYGLRLALMRAIAQLPIPPKEKQGRAVRPDGTPPQAFNGGTSSANDGIVPLSEQPLGV